MEHNDPRAPTTRTPATPVADDHTTRRPGGAAERGR